MPNLPSGTVTFLFTDIEGSTALWEQDRAAMREAVARQLAILQSLIEAHHGVLYKTIGDGTQSAFASAEDALHAAVAAQRALLQEIWADPPGPVQVRMALHAGEAAPDERGDYRSASLNRLARLLAAGHGGQILLTQTVQQLSRGVLPEGAAIRDLGEHRLRDLLDPEQIFQLLHSSLPSQFPPLETLAKQSHNLPIQLTPLVGRGDDVAAILGLITQQGVRLLTLTGPGGTGKTRLALAVAAELLDAFPDGTWFVDLAHLNDPVLVPSTIARTLGLHDSSGRSVQEVLFAYLAAKHALLVFDNYEHLLEAAPVVSDLLQASPGTVVLVTSRSPLRLSGEFTFPVPPLALPDAQHVPSVRELSDVAAVRLFTERARAASGDFVLNEDNAAVVARICRHLDGMPLAIELAASWTRFLTPASLLERLNARLLTLGGGPRDAPARQQTIRATIAWSYDLLTSAEQPLFRRLSVFVGGCTLESAEAVVNSAGELDVFEGLASLVDKSLVRQADGPADEPRFAMLETIREYGVEQLDAVGEGEITREAHAAWCATLADLAQPELGGPDEKVWLDRLEREHDNLRAALAASIARADGETALRLAAALWRFWYLRGHASEGRQWLERALVAGNGGSPALRAQALLSLGYLDLGLEDIDSGRTQLEESLAIVRALGDRVGEANALHGLGRVARLQGDFTRAQTFHEQSLAIRRELGDEPGLAVSYHNLGEIAYLVGDYRRARERHEAALRLRERLGDTGGAAVSRCHLGEVAASEGDVRTAREQFDQSLAQAQTIGDKLCITDVLCGLAGLACMQDDLRGALSLYHESLRLREETGDRFGIADNLEGVAGVACGLGQLERCATIFAAAAARRDALGTPRSPAAQAAYDQAIAAARRALGQEAFDVAWAKGRAMTIEEAVDFGLRVEADSPMTDQAAATDRPLSFPG